MILIQSPMIDGVTVNARLDRGGALNYPRLLLAAVAALVAFFAWGFLTEGWLLRKDFAASAALYRTSDLQMKYMPLGLASVTQHS